MPDIMTGVISFQLKMTRESPVHFINMVHLQVVREATSCSHGTLSWSYFSIRCLLVFITKTSGYLRKPRPRKICLFYPAFKTLKADASLRKTSLLFKEASQKPFLPQKNKNRPKNELFPRVRVDFAFAKRGTSYVQWFPDFVKQ